MMMSSESVQGKISRKKKRMGQGTCRPTSGMGTAEEHLVVKEYIWSLFIIHK